jgi:hypothetical protein
MGIHYIGQAIAAFCLARPQKPASKMRSGFRIAYCYRTKRRSARSRRTSAGSYTARKDLLARVVSVGQHELRIARPLHLRPLADLQLLCVRIVQEPFDALLFLRNRAGEISVFLLERPYLSALGLQGVDALWSAKHDGGIRRKRDKRRDGSNRT